MEETSTMASDAGCSPGATYHMVWVKGIVDNQ